MGPAPISWKDVNHYASAYDLNHEEFEDLLYVISEIDREFLSWQSTKP